MRDQVERYEAAAGTDSRSSKPANGGRGETIGDLEICRMVAFRIRETANRIAALANNAQDEELRRELQEVCQRLLREERALLELHTPPTA